MNTLVILCALFGACLASYGQKSYEKETYKSCYQCAYSPPKTYYDKKVVIEKQNYEYGGGNSGYDGYGKRGGYYKKTYVPVQKTVYGGWDKCENDFTYEQADLFGVDVWDCHSNCYVRTDPNGDIFRGCYKGEYGVNPNKLGCSKQAGSEWCFCAGDKCNNKTPRDGYSK